MSPRAATPDDLKSIAGWRLRLDRLGATVDMAGLCRYLRSQKHAVSMAQEIRASALLARLAREGASIDGPEAAARWFAPVLSTSRTDQRRVREHIAFWWESGEDRPEREADPLTEIVREVEDERKRRTWYWAGLAAAVAALVPLANSLLSSGGAGFEGFGGDFISPLTAENPAEATAALILEQVMPRLYLVLPFVLLAWALLRRRPPRQSAMRRETGDGHLFASLPIPKAEIRAFADSPAATAVLALKASSPIPSRSLDVPKSIRATVRAAGMPQISYASGRRSHEYVILCERGGAADHTALLADALVERFENADVPFTRFDADGHFMTVRHAAGPRSGLPVESLAEVASRYMGARLIVFGSGDSFFDGVSGEFARAPGFTPTNQLARLFGAFDLPVFLTTTPEARWGRREQRIADRGVAVFPASSVGLARAAAYFAFATDEEDPAIPSEIRPGEDHLLLELRTGRERLVSDIEPDEEDAAMLVAQLRGFIGGDMDFRVLACVAAFPRMDPAITLYLGEKVRGQPVGERLAQRLARLPWFQDGRMPDWLRVALLRALPPQDRAIVRNVLNKAVAELLAFAEARKHDPKLDRPAASQVDLVTRPEVRSQILSRLGFGGGLISGESVFLRFLSGESLEDLDQPAPEIATPPGPWQRTGAAAALIAAAGLAVYGGAWPVAAGQFLIKAVEGIQGVEIVLLLLVVPYWLLHLTALRPARVAGDLTPLPWWLGGSFWMRRLDRQRDQERVDILSLQQIQDAKRSLKARDSEAAGSVGEEDLSEPARGQKEIALAERLNALEARVARQRAAARRVGRLSAWLRWLEWPLHVFLLLLLLGLTPQLGQDEVVPTMGAHIIVVIMLAFRVAIWTQPGALSAPPTTAPLSAGAEYGVMLAVAPVCLILTTAFYRMIDLADSLSRESQVVSVLVAPAAALGALAVGTLYLIAVPPAPGRASGFVRAAGRLALGFAAAVSGISIWLTLDLGVLIALDSLFGLSLTNTSGFGLLFALMPVGIAWMFLYASPSLAPAVRFFLGYAGFLWAAFLISMAVLGFEEPLLILGHGFLLIVCAGASLLLARRRATAGRTPPERQAALSRRKLELAALDTPWVLTLAFGAMMVVNGLVGPVFHLAALSIPMVAITARRYGASATEPIALVAAGFLLKVDLLGAATPGGLWMVPILIMIARAAMDPKLFWPGVTGARFGWWDAGILFALISGGVSIHVLAPQSFVITGATPGFVLTVIACALGGGGIPFYAAIGAVAGLEIFFSTSALARAQIDWAGALWIHFGTALSLTVALALTPPLIRYLRRSTHLDPPGAEEAAGLFGLDRGLLWALAAALAAFAFVQVNPRLFIPSAGTASWGDTAQPLFTTQLLVLLAFATGALAGHRKAQTSTRAQIRLLGVITTAMTAATLAIQVLVIGMVPIDIPLLGDMIRIGGQFRTGTFEPQVLFNWVELAISILAFLCFGYWLGRTLQADGLARMTGWGQARDGETAADPGQRRADRTGFAGALSTQLLGRSWTLTILLAAGLWFATAIAFEIGAPQLPQFLDPGTIQQQDQKSQG